MIRPRASVLALALVLALTPATAAARGAGARRCSCYNGGPLTALRASAAVFVGRVVDVGPVDRRPRAEGEQRYWEPERDARFVVTYALKGVADGDTVVVHYVDESNSPGNCGTIFSAGEGYLVYAGWGAPPGAPLSTGYCDGTKPLAYAAADLERLGVLLSPPPSPARAFGAVTGSVYDSASGRPVQRAWACISVPTAYAPNGRPVVYTARCAPANRGGLFLLDSVPAGRQSVGVMCEVEPSAIGRTLARLDVDVTPGSTVRRDVPASDDGCDRRPVFSVTGVVRGHYTRVFERSTFVACGDTSWSWVELADPQAARRVWNASDGQAPYRHVYVRWLATRTGPGRYGRLGVIPYEMRVLRVLEARRPRRDDCG